MSTTNGKKTEPRRPVIKIERVSAPGKPGKHLVWATADGSEVSRDTIDLNSATARKRFVGATMRGAFPGQDPDDWPHDERERLDAELLKLAQVPPGPAEPLPVEAKGSDDPRVEKLAEMPENVRAEAERRLHASDLLERVGEDIESQGAVGEEKNRLIIYLVGTSAQLPQPLSLIVRGATSMGKSYLCDKVMQLFPPEVVLEATGMTTNALFYFENGTLRHRIILAGERSRVENDDQAEASRALREMISKGRLSKAVPLRDNVSGRMTTVMIEQDGPISHIETTTSESIFGEDANRCLLLDSDESDPQTAQIIHVTALAAEHIRRCSEVADRIRQVHHAMQRMLPRVDVQVPFATAIAGCYRRDGDAPRRRFSQLLQLVRASALLHFKQRERLPTGEVVATLGDYTNVEAIARAPFARAGSGVSEGARDLFIKLRDAFDQCEFTTTEAKKVKDVGKARSVLSRLNALAVSGAIEQTQSSGGNVPAKWRVTGGDPDAGNGPIPTVEQVRQALARSAHAHKDEKR